MDELNEFIELVGFIELRVERKDTLRRDKLNKLLILLCWVDE